MTNSEGYRNLSFSVFQSAFKDLIKDKNVEKINNRVCELKEKEIELKEQREEKSELQIKQSRKRISLITRLNLALRTNNDSRRFFEKKDFYPWIEFVEYDEDFIVDKYRKLVGRK